MSAVCNARTMTVSSESRCLFSYLFRQNVTTACIRYWNCGEDLVIEKARVEG